MRDDFDQVVHDNAAKLYGLCFKLTGQTQEAEDLCQETFSKALKAYGRFEGRSQVSTWLYRIAVNAWKNRLRGRRLKFFSMFSSNDEEEPAFDAKGNDPLPEEGFEKKQDGDRFRHAMGLLSAEERLIVTLRDLEEKTYEEIAELLDVPVGTVKSRLSRARQSLKQKLIPLLKSSGEIS